MTGSGGLAAAPTEAGILCGMNYWHKTNKWIWNGATVNFAMGKGEK